MNREQKRAQIKQLQKKGMKKSEAARLVNQFADSLQLEEGATVKLNYDLMTSLPDWNNQREEYKAWVEAHKDEYMTVEWDARRKEANTRDKKIMVCLKEDETDPKWLFHSSVLTPVAVATVKMNSGEEVKVNLDGVTDINDERIQTMVNEALLKEEQKKEANNQ